MAGIMFNRLLLNNTIFMQQYYMLDLSYIKLPKLYFISNQSIFLTCKG